MLPALLLLAGMADWTPMRWASGDPHSLALLEGTPVNCLLLERSCQAPALLKQAAARGVATLAVLDPAGDLAGQARRATALGMQGVVLEGNFDAAAVDSLRAALRGSSACLIELPDRRRIRLGGRDPILGTSQGLWPGIEIEHGGTVLAGPTSAPWINTNSGFLRFLRASTGSILWFGVRPPPGRIFPVERYLQAIGDAALAGVRWIVALDADLERRLLAREPAAVRDWRRIARHLAYFEDHREWRGWRPYSRFALVQDAANGGLLSAGLLDMISVQHTPVRVIPPGRLGPESLRGVRIALSVDSAPNPALAAFGRAGGTVLAPPAGWKFPPVPDSQFTLERRQLEQMEPLWEIVYRATARKNFGVRLFNVSSTLATVAASPDGRSLLVHLLNFTSYAGESITVHALGNWKRARLYSPEGEVRELQLYPTQDGVGVDIDRMQTLASLRLDE